MRMTASWLLALAAIATLVFLAQPYAFPQSSSQVNATVMVVCPYQIALSMLPAYPRTLFITVNYTVFAIQACNLGAASGSFRSTTSWTVRSCRSSPSASTGWALPSAKFKRGFRHYGHQRRQLFCPHEPLGGQLLHLHLERLFARHQWHTDSAYAGAGQPTYDINQTIALTGSWNGGLVANNGKVADSPGEQRCILCPLHRDREKQQCNIVAGIDPWHRELCR